MDKESIDKKIKLFNELKEEIENDIFNEVLLDNNFFENIGEALDIAIKALNYQKENSWILIKDKMPKDRKPVFVKDVQGNRCIRERRGAYTPTSPRWSRRDSIEVVAWKEIPDNVDFLWFTKRYIKK